MKAKRVLDAPAFASAIAAAAAVDVLLEDREWRDLVRFDLSSVIVEV